MAVMLLTMYDVHELCAHEGMFAVPALDIEKLGQLRCHDSGHDPPHCAVQCGTTEVTKMQDPQRRGRHLMVALGGMPAYVFWYRTGAISIGSPRIETIKSKFEDMSPC